jgi:uncharacterized membrane protein
MSAISIAHVSFGTSALVFGTLNVIRAKGTASHRLIGHAFYVSMLGLNGTAFGIYTFFGTFGVFHFLAALSLAYTVAAIVPVLVRRPRNRWAVMHGSMMLYSYLGLLAATAAELAVRLPPPWNTDTPGRYFFGAALLASGVITVVGFIWIPRAMHRVQGSSAVASAVAAHNDAVRSAAMG